MTNKVISKDPHILLRFTQPLFHTVFATKNKVLKMAQASAQASAQALAQASAQASAQAAAQASAHRRRPIENFEFKKWERIDGLVFFYLSEHRSAHPRLKFRNSLKLIKFSQKIGGLSPNIGMDGLFGRRWMGTCGQGC